MKKTDSTLNRFFLKSNEIQQATGNNGARRILFLLGFWSDICFCKLPKKNEREEIGLQY